MKFTTIFMMILMVSIATASTTGIWPTANLNNEKTASVQGSVLNGTFTTGSIASCEMAYQPIVYDLDMDGENEIYVFCNNKIKVYDPDFVLIQEKNVGTLLGSPAISPGVLYIGAVINRSGDENLTYWSFNGTDMIEEETHTKTGFGGGNNVFCPTASFPCYATFENMIEVDFEDRNYCHYENPYVLCYDTANSTGTPTLNYSQGSCDQVYKIIPINTDGGFDEIIMFCGITNAIGFDLIDDDGTQLTNVDLSTSGGFKNGFVVDNNICVISMQVVTTTVTERIYCYNTAGSNVYTYSNSFTQFTEGLLTSAFDRAGSSVNVVVGDYNNDGYKDLFTNSVIFDLQNKVFLKRHHTSGDGASRPANIVVTDIDLDGSLDYIYNYHDTDTIYWAIDGYTNIGPEITQIAWNTGNPMCLNSIMTYTISFDDTEDDDGQIRVDKYGDGNWSSWGSLSGFPTQSVTYDQLGSYTSVIELRDEAGNVDNITHGVIIQTSNCYASGDGGASSSSSSGLIGEDGLECQDFGGFVLCGENAIIDGYTPQNTAGNSRLSFDSSECSDRLGDNYQNNIIPCWVRLLFLDILGKAQAWILGSFILVVIVLILFVAYQIHKSNRR